MGNWGSRELPGVWRVGDRVRSLRRGSFVTGYAIGDLATVAGPAVDVFFRIPDAVVVNFDGGKGNVHRVDEGHGKGYVRLAYDVVESALPGGWRAGDRVRALVDNASQKSARGDVGTVLGPSTNTSRETAAELLQVDFGSGKGKGDVLWTHLESALPGGWRRGDRAVARVDYEERNVSKGDTVTVVGPADSSCESSAQRVRVYLGDGKGSIDMLGETELEHETLPGGWRKGDRVTSLIDFPPQSISKGDLGTICGPCREVSPEDAARRVYVNFGEGKGSLYANGETQLARASAERLLADMLATERQRREASAPTFYFLRAEKIRDSSLAKLPKLQDIKKLYPDWVMKLRVDMTDSLLGRYRESSLGVSHRWVGDDPDPNGTQLAAIRRYLQAHPEIRYVWFDFACLPQRPRTRDEEGEFRAMLRSSDAIYTGMKVLILLDQSSSSRFWPLVEAWMSMQDATVSGLTKTPEERKRYTIQPLLRATEKHAELLVGEWSEKSAREAHDLLSSGDVTVTNQSDKEELLPKVLRFNETVIDLLKTHEARESALRQIANATAAQDATALRAALTAAVEAGVAPLNTRKGSDSLAALLGRRRV